MVVTSDNDGTWFYPRLALGLIALAVVLLILNFDTRLGIGAGIVFGSIGALWLYLALRYGSLRGGPPSERAMLGERVRQQASNRRLAASRIEQGRTPPANPRELP